MTDDPLHQPGAPDRYWTTINAEENLPGVVDPLSGTFWLPPVTLGALGAFADMGVVRESDVVFGPNPDDWISSLICGRYCVNADLLRRLADSMPGTSGDAMERDLFGTPRTGIPSQRDLRRYPVVAVKAPRTAFGVVGKMRAALPVSHAWWRAQLAELADADAAAAHRAVRAGQHHMATMMRGHNLVTMLVPGILTEVRKLAEAAGRPELELELSRGLESLEEVGLLARLWELSRGRGDRDAFLADYGFHCNRESMPTAVAWREDPATVDALIARYRDMDEARSPLVAAAAVAERRRTATAELLSALPAWRRPGARFLLSYGDKLWALRETGKASYLHGIDVARAGARIVGRDLADRGALEDPADVAYLTADEVIAGDSVDWSEAVAFRRERREVYASYEVPQMWTGAPEPLTVADPGATTEVRGLAGSPGVAAGTVRVIADPTTDDLEDGDVLVCKTTDPSWATLFLAASAVVIDVGAPSSHGAIVARELGIPCVINTRTGTTTLRDGDHVEVDGTSGTVRLLRGSSGSPPFNRAG